ncbi:MAG: MFS transporter [Usitatibacter sp.]
MAGEDLGTADEPKWERPSAWAPLREPTFRMLWLVWMAANITLWMNDVAAAWVMTTLTASPVKIALVQTASSLPVFLLGLPSGAFADILDRRRYFIVTQFWVAASAAVLFAFTVMGALTANWLLLLVFANGIGLAMRWPVFAAIVPELVPRQQLGAALALNGVAMNLSRVVGPLVAGTIIAAAGSQYVFALNFVLSILAAFVLIRWRRESKPSVLPGERFIGAMRLGWQYVRESQRMKDAIIRTAAFFLHATALLALLPLEAKRLGDGTATTYTYLLASLGLGAVTAATQLPRLRPRWNRDHLADGGSIIQAIATTALAFSPSLWTAAPAMFVAGVAWIVVANSVTIAAQLALPDWVRARGMSIYQMAIMGSAALGAVIWGRIAEWTGVPASLVCASASMLVFLVVTRGRPLEGRAEEDHTPTRPFSEPVPARPLELDDGPVMVTLEYQIDPQRGAEFESIMAESRSARLRQGAVSWGLFEDVQVPGRYVEYFACDTWADYLRRFDRFTAMDQRLQEMRYAFHLGTEPPRISRFIAKHTVAR